MKNKITLLLTCLFGFYSVLSQDNFLRTNSVGKSKTAQGESSTASYNLNFNGLKEVLSQSPIMGVSSGNSNLIVTIPDENGNFLQFRMIEKPNLHPDLAKKFPDIKSYSGVSVNGGQTTVHISMSSNQISGVIIDTKYGKSQFIKKQNGSNTYTITSAVEEENGVFENGDPFGNDTHSHDNPSNHGASTNGSSSNAGRSARTVRRNFNDATLRTFRLALATTAEFSNYYINMANVSNGTTQQKKAAVLAGLNAIDKS